MFLNKDLSMKFLLSKMNNTKKNVLKMVKTIKLLSLCMAILYKLTYFSNGKESTLSLKMQT